MSTGPETYRPVPKTWRQASNALLFLCLAAWMGLATMIALAGWATRSAFHQNFGLSLIVLGALVGVVVITRKKAFMRRYAQHSLQARADLQSLELDSTMEGMLVVFDVTHDRVRGLLSEPGLEEVVDVSAIERHLATSGDELFELARRHTSLRADEDRLSRQSKTAVVESALTSSAEQRARIEEAAARIATELQTLQEKVEATRALARSVTRGEDEAERLRDASRELDASAAAIREIALLK